MSIKFEDQSEGFILKELLVILERVGIALPFVLAGPGIGMSILKRLILFTNRLPDLKKSQTI